MGTNNHSPHRRPLDNTRQCIEMVQDHDNKFNLVMDTEKVFRNAMFENDKLFSNKKAITNYSISNILI